MIVGAWRLAEAANVERGKIVYCARKWDTKSNSSRYGEWATVTGTLTRPLGELRFESGVPGGSNWKRWKNYLELDFAAPHQSSYYLDNDSSPATESSF